MRKSLILSLAVAGIGLVSLINSSDAAVIYSDTLVGTGALNGVTVDTSTGIAGGTAGATWVGDNTVKTATGAEFGGAFGFFLPIAIETGHVYNLTATVTAVGASWTAIGFSDSSIHTDYWHQNNKFAWALVRPAGDRDGGPVFFGGASTANGQTWTSTAQGMQTVTVTLDTTTTGAWKTFATIGGVNSDTYTYGANPAISFLGFGNAGGTTSTVTDFSLSTVVPEPASLGLLSLAGLALLRRRK